MYIHIYIYICIYICICIYVYIYVYIEWYAWRVPTSISIRPAWLLLISMSKKTRGFESRWCGGGVGVSNKWMYPYTKNKNREPPRIMFLHEVPFGRWCDVPGSISISETVVDDGASFETKTCSSPFPSVWLLGSSSVNASRSSSSSFMQNPHRSTNLFFSGNDYGPSDRTVQLYGP